MKINEIVLKENLKVTGNDSQGVHLAGSDGTVFTIPHNKLAALTPNPNDPNKFSINPAVFDTTANNTANTDGSIGPKVGSDVEISTSDIQTTETFDDEELIGSSEPNDFSKDLVDNGNHDVGRDATDSFINQITDKDFEKSARNGGIAESAELIAMLTIAGLR